MSVINTVISFVRTTLEDAVKLLSSPRNLLDYVKNPLRKNSIFLIATSIVNGLSGFFFWAIAARTYPSEQVGLAVTLISAMLLLVTLSRLGLDVGLVRFLPEAGDKKGLINSSFTLATILCVIAALIFIAGLNFWSPVLLFIRANPVFSLLFVIFTIAASLTMLQGYLFIALRAAHFTFIQSLITAAKVIFIALPLALGVMGIFSFWGMAAFLSLIVGIFFTARLVPAYRPFPVIKRGLIKEMVRFSFISYIGDSFRELPKMVLPLLIANVLNPPMAAYFYIALSIANILFTISHATGFSLLTEASYKQGKLSSLVIRAMKFILLLIVPAVLIILFFGRELLLLFGQEYSDNAFKLLSILALSSIPLAINTLYIAVKRVQKKLKPVVLVNAFIAAVTIGAGYLLMDSLGLVGVGVAWITAQGAASIGIGVVLIFRRRIRLAP